MLGNQIILLAIQITKIRHTVWIGHQVDKE